MHSILNPPANSVKATPRAPPHVLASDVLIADGLEPRGPAVALSRPPSLKSLPTSCQAANTCHEMLRSPPYSAPVHKAAAKPSPADRRAGPPGSSRVAGVDRDDGRVAGHVKGRRVLPAARTTPSRCTLPSAQPSWTKPSDRGRMRRALPQRSRGGRGGRRPPPPGASWRLRGRGAWGWSACMMST
jgi:hypothetical protein